MDDWLTLALELKNAWQRFERAWMVDDYQAEQRARRQLDRACRQIDEELAPTAGVGRGTSGKFAAWTKENGDD